VSRKKIIVILFVNRGWTRIGNFYMIVWLV